MFKPVFSKNLYTVSLLIIIAAGIMIGCNGESSTESGKKQVSGGAVDSFPSTSRELESNPDSKRKLFVKVVEKGAGRAVPGAMVQILFNVPAKLDSVFTANRTANAQGIAEFNLPEFSRLVVISEYCKENHPLEYIAEGDLEYTLEVETNYALAGRVTGPDGKGIKGAEVFLVFNKPNDGVKQNALRLPGMAITIEQFKRFYGYDLVGQATTEEGGSFSCNVKSRRQILACAWVDGLLCPHWRTVSFNNKDNHYENVEIPLLSSGTLDLVLYNTNKQTLGEQVIVLKEAPISILKRKEPETIHQPLTLVVKTDPQGKVHLDLPADIDLFLEGKLLFSMPTKDDFPDPIHTAPIQSFTLKPDQDLKLIAVPPNAIRLFGYVQDIDGNHLKGARITLPTNSFLVDDKIDFSILVPYNRHLGMTYTVTKKGYLEKYGAFPQIEPGSMELSLTPVIEKGIDLTIITDPAVDMLSIITTSSADSESNITISGCERLDDIGALIVGKKAAPGQFTFSSLPTGTVTLLAQKGCFSFFKKEGVEIVASPDFKQKIDITKESSEEAFSADGGCSLEGKVSLPEGIVPHRLIVSVMRNDISSVRPWDPLMIGKNAMGSKTTLVGEDGTFLVEGLSPGRYSVNAVIMEWNMRIDIYEEVQIQTGNNYISLKSAQVEDFGSFEVCVTDSEANPISGVSLLLLDPVDSPIAQAKHNNSRCYSNSEGKILINNMMPGRYGFSLHYQGGIGYLLDARVEVTKGALTEVKIVLP